MPTICHKNCSSFLQDHSLHTDYKAHHQFHQAKHIFRLICRDTFTNCVAIQDLLWPIDIDRTCYMIYERIPKNNPKFTHMILNGRYFTASCWTRNVRFILIHSSFIIIWSVLWYQIAVNRGRGAKRNACVDVKECRWNDEKGRNRTKIVISQRKGKNVWKFAEWENNKKKI